MRASVEGLTAIYPRGGKAILYELISADAKESYLFYRLDGDVAAQHGAIGYLRADFGKGGNGFYTTWFDAQRDLKTPDFQREIDEVINYLRDGGAMPPFASRKNLGIFCASQPTHMLDEAATSCFKICTAAHTYYFRCKPSKTDYDIFLFCFDNRRLLPMLSLRAQLMK